MDWNMDSNILKSTAIQKPFTAKPSIKASASRIMTALITSRNNPSVITVMGNVRTTRTGLTMSFNNAKTTATMMALKYPATATPGRSFANNTTATAVRRILKSNFIVGRY